MRSYRGGLDRKKQCPIEGQSSEFPAFFARHKGYAGEYVYMMLQFRSIPAVIAARSKLPLPPTSVNNPSIIMASAGLLAPLQYRYHLLRPHVPLPPR
jgi:hypothetical protein